MENNDKKHFDAKNPNKVAATHDDNVTVSSTATDRVHVYTDEDHVTRGSQSVRDNQVARINKDHTFEDDYKVYDDRAGRNISWRAILAGVVTFIATGIVFSLITAAIGLGTPTLTASQPFEGVGAGLIIWTIVSLVISLGLAGYVAGITANKTGLIHGFLTWATSVIVLFFLVTNVVSSAFGFVGNVLGTAGQAVGTVATEVGSTVGSLTEEAFTNITEGMEIDTTELEGNVQDVLEDTEIEELQPGYLQDQLQATTQDIGDAGYAIVVGGEDPQQVFDKLTSTIEDRVNNIAQEIDRDALEEAVAANTDLNEEEAAEAVDNIEQGYNEAAQQASDMITQAESAVNDLQTQAQQAWDEAVRTAEEVSDEVAKYSLYTFIGLIIGLVVTAIAAHYGAKATIPDNIYGAHRNPVNTNR